MNDAYAGFTTHLLNSVDSAVRGFTQTAFQAVVQAHQTEIHLALVLYIALFGYAVLSGAIELSVMRAVRHILIMAVVVSIGTHWEYFALYFNDVFTDGPAKLVAALSGGSVDPNALLSDVFDKGIIAANTIRLNAGLSTLGFLIISYSVFYATLIGIGYALFLLIMSKLALAVLLALAPVFFMLFLFQGTRDFFTQYLRQVFNFAMIPVFTSAVLGLTLGIVSDALSRLQATLVSHSGHGGPECVYVILCFVVLFMLLHQVMGLSSAVAGGLQLSTGNLLGMASAYLVGNAQTHATETKRNMGRLSMWSSRKAGYGVGRASSLFRRKKAS